MPTLQTQMLRALLSIGGSDRMLRNAAALRREERTRELSHLTANKVVGGPFIGMQLPLSSSWGDGYRAAKLLGAYEHSLHDALSKAVSRQPSIIINVGCAEGYYAVGLARLLPGAKVFAFDIDRHAQAACTAAAQINGVSGRVVVSGLCTAADIERLIGPSLSSLIVMDCEGGELELLDPAIVPQLATSDILVETHDFVKPKATQRIAERFGPSHDVDQMYQGSCDVNAFAIMQEWSELERYLMLSEDRPSNMTWLACWTHFVKNNNGRFTQDLFSEKLDSTR